MIMIFFLNPHYWGYVEVLAHIIIKFSREVVNIVNLILTLSVLMTPK